jgi:hypothetical protein
MSLNHDVSQPLQTRKPRQIGHDRRGYKVRPGVGVADSLLPIGNGGDRSGRPG